MLLRLNVYLVYNEKKLWTFTFILLFICLMLKRCYSTDDIFEQQNLYILAEQQNHTCQCRLGANPIR